MKKKLKIDTGLLKAMFSCTQDQLKGAMEDFIEDVYGNDCIITDKYIIGLGDLPIGLVSHMDTVHPTPAYKVYHDKEENVMWSPMGLGADDRAGVYSIIHIINSGYKPTVILTTDEEVGGVGAAALAREITEMPTELKFLLELDRRGSNDCVFYECDNPDFEKYINSFGFVTDIGSFSDICFIAPDWGISAANLSIGYYDEHTKQEILKLDEMERTIERVCRILDDSHNAEYYKHMSRKQMGSWDMYPWEDDGKELCWNCMDTFNKNDMVQTEGGEFYCLECYAKLIRYCDSCGSEYSLSNSLYNTEQNLCPFCSRDYLN